MCARRRSVLLSIGYGNLWTPPVYSAMRKNGKRMYKEGTTAW